MGGCYGSEFVLWFTGISMNIIASGSEPPSLLNFPNFHYIYNYTYTVESGV